MASPLRRDASRPARIHPRLVHLDRRQGPRRDRGGSAIGQDALHVPFRHLQRCAAVAQAKGPDPMTREFDFEKWCDPTEEINPFVKQPFGVEVDGRRYDCATDRRSFLAVPGERYPPVLGTIRTKP
jgi:hypothetical protein